MRDLVDEHYPEAERIRVVLDNLSIHASQPRPTGNASAAASPRRQHSSRRSRSGSAAAITTELASTGCSPSSALGRSSAVLPPTCEATCAPCAQSRGMNRSDPPVLGFRTTEAKNTEDDHAEEHDKPDHRMLTQQIRSIPAMLKIATNFNESCSIGGRDSAFANEVVDHLGGVAVVRGAHRSPPVSWWVS